MKAIVYNSFSLLCDSIQCAPAWAHACSAPSPLCSQVCQATQTDFCCTAKKSRSYLFELAYPLIVNTRMHACSQFVGKPCRRAMPLQISKKKNLDLVFSSTVKASRRRRQVFATDTWRLKITGSDTANIVSGLL